MNGDASISCNEAKGNGGGVYMDGEKSTFTMNGDASISCNEAKGNGGGVYMDGGKFTMTGGEISGNEAKGNGGGVYMDGTTFTVSGAAKVTGNKKNNANNNVYLPKGKNITIGAAQTDLIGVTTANAPTEDGTTIATAGSGYTITDADKASFYSDNISYQVVHEGDKLVLKASTPTPPPPPPTPTEHKHFLCGKTHTAIGDHKTDTQIIFTKWTNENALPDTPGSYYLDTDVTLSSSWKPVDGTVLCLNGHSITADGNGDIPAILVYSGSITLCDCKGDDGAYGKITHPVGKNGSGVYVRGTFNMYGGSITNNTADNGGGVYMTGENSKFNMYGGEISGNTATVSGGGVDVSGGTFTMSGGSITGNNGSGVCVSDRATFTVSDAPTVTGNTMNRDDSNVYLEGGAYITIGGALTDGASIGVTKGGSPQDSVIATGATKDYSGKFSSDDSTYVVKHDAATKKLVLAVPSAVTHTHSWQFTKETGNDSTIFVSCKGTPGSCDYKNTPATVKISTDQTVYDCAQITEAPKAKLTHSVNWPKDVVQAQENDIKYWRSNDGGTSYTVPVTDNNELKKPGKYLAQLKFNGNWLEARFSVVDNGKQDPTYTAPTAKTGLVYNGTAQVLINEGHVEGCKMQYRLDNGGDYSDSLPTATNAGTYTVWYKVVGDDSHNNVVAEKSIKVWIEKAPLSGTPTFTKVTGAGKTLKDVAFTKADGWPDGEFKWDNGAAGYDMNAPLVQGEAYSWLYLADNYYAKGTVVLWANPSSGGGSSSGSSGGGGGSSSGSSDSNPVIKTETKNHADGSTTKTETRKDGSVTQTTTGKDGSVSKTETKKDGSSVTENKAADGSTGTVKTDKNGQTEAKTALSSKAIEDAKRNGEAVKAPVEVKATRNSSTAPTVKVELPRNSGETKVEIPVSNVTPGTVAVLVHPDGTEEIVKNSVPTEDGIQLTVDGNATVKIVDNSKGFIDTQDHWAKDAIDFVSARGLVSGMSATIYAPNNSTTRAQLWTILARQNDADLSGGSVWYEKAQNWAKDKGVSDGTDPNAAINRAQMVTMLWRAAGQSAAAGSAANFTDVPADSYYAQAVAWAVENGITAGVGGGRFDPNGTCTRAQIAAFLYRYMK